MIKAKMTSFGAIALALGGLAVTCAADAPERAVSNGAKAARKAAKALNAHDSDAAVSAAEAAVAFAPREAGYRLLLGQGYLQAGRFTSAAQAFADTLTLDGTNGKAALNLALAQIATGDWRSARATLQAHDEIPAGDRGLALALAGETQGAVAMLTDAARAPTATPKVRQNLALAYALAGQWQIARVIASADLSPADVDARLQQWAAFAQPDGASAQVATLLGVQPVADRGQPEALALNAAAPAVQVAAVERAPLVSVPVPAAVPFTRTAATTRIAFAAPHEVVQPLPAALIRAQSEPIKVAVRPRAAPMVKLATQATTPAPAPVRVAAFKPASGSWYVQLGAYESVGVARDAWGHAAQRYAAFATRQPNGMSFHSGAGAFYRLSLGGFDRSSADQLCRGYRAHGGACFVRPGAGDQMAAWVKKGGVQVASR